MGSVVPKGDELGPARLPEAAEEFSVGPYSGATSVVPGGQLDDGNGHVAAPYALPEPAVAL